MAILAVLGDGGMIEDDLNEGSMSVGFLLKLLLRGLLSAVMRNLRPRHAVYLIFILNTIYGLLILKYQAYLNITRDPGLETAWLYTRRYRNTIDLHLQ